ncbi:MAG: Fic family protein [Coriobacteriales bacterium]|nr:Fic family protein [Coriobacteriales bacterium]
MSDELDVLLREVDRKKAEFGLRPPLAPDADEAYQERFLFDSIYHSNAIEGNSLTRDEVERVLTANAVVEGKTLSDHVAVLGYRDATLLGQRYVREKTRITEHEIKNLHHRMLIDQQAVGGEYRNYNLMIHGHRPTSYEKVPYKMLQLCDARPSEDRHPIESIAFFHLRLEKIHPFGDGNGRVGRVIINIMLEQLGYPAVIVRVDDRQAYYEALNAYDGLDGNPRVQPMQLFLTRLVSRHLDELLALGA